ncbi:hypothetical protein MIR68_001072 [Amoeboaphelidium protococcarum]|nr:hypothetical protein MIR68_001072 [Amoeboaphelidium protococcarum]
MNYIFIGQYIHCLSFDEVEMKSGVIVVKDGRVERLESAIPEDIDSAQYEIVTLHENQFLLPGFIDTHFHAPQYLNLGLGLDLPLLDWLNKYTFPRETLFQDADVARAVYPHVARKTIQNGTTSCVYYATIHLQSCKVLADIVSEMGQRALVGLVNMDRNSPDTLVQSTDQSLRDSEEFITYVQQELKSDKVRPVITPRFAISCTDELLAGLGKLAQKYQVPVQSHLSENLKEIEWTMQLFPKCKTYSQVYDTHGLMNTQTIMAHGVHLSDEELQLLSQRGVGIAHCANSNFSILSGVCDVRRLISAGVKVGLGTDVGAGSSVSMLDAMRNTVTASKVLAQQKDQLNLQLTPYHALYLATMGGAQLMNDADKIGNFLPGKRFDALVVKVCGKDDTKNIKHRDNRVMTGMSTASDNIDVWNVDSLQDKFHRFFYSGDDRNIINVFIDGKRVK